MNYDNPKENNRIVTVKEALDEELKAGEKGKNGKCKHGFRHLCPHCMKEKGQTFAK